MDDLNKSPLTCDVTSAVALWLDAMGFKPVETEVPMPWIVENEKGWIADLAGVIIPTQTELINLKLLTRSPKLYLSDDGEDKFTHNPAYDKWAKERDAKQRLMTCLVEVKTTRADFLGDRKWNLAPPYRSRVSCLSQGPCRLIRVACRMGYLGISQRRNQAEAFPFPWTDNF